MKRNQIADFEDDDSGWQWVIKMWSPLSQNVTYLKGMVIEKQILEGEI